MHAGFEAFFIPLARNMTSLLLHKLMYYVRILATPPPPYAACILNQWPFSVFEIEFTVSYSSALNKSSLTEI